MMLGGATSPSPSPSGSSDPFNPDVTIWPEAPGWLFPTVMGATGLVIVAVIVLIVMWRRSVAYEKQQQAAKGPTQWVDLSKLDRKGRWEDDGPALDGGQRPTLDPPSGPNSP